MLALAEKHTGSFSSIKSQTEIPYAIGHLHNSNVKMWTIIKLFFYFPLPVSRLIFLFLRHGAVLYFKAGAVMGNPLSHLFPGAQGRRDTSGDWLLREAQLFVVRIIDYWLLQKPEREEKPPCILLNSSTCNCKGRALLFFFFFPHLLPLLHPWCFMTKWCKAHHNLGSWKADLIHIYVSTFSWYLLGVWPGD